VNALQKLRSIVDELRSNREPLKMLDQWALAGRLLTRTPADPARVQQAVRARDIDELNAIVRSLEQPSAPPPPPAAAAHGFSKEELDHALKLFRKQLKVSRLADESKLGGRYTSGGKKSAIDAMQPPTELPHGIWKALVAEGRLVDTGGGFYAEPSTPVER
jgi:hypothetical protein